ncbi:MAG: 4-oxalocrotonate tautomerase family protein [Catenulispora sp.]
MPTITIETPGFRPARRRAVAVRLTRWLRTHGADPAHVVVHFVDTGGDSVFTGGLPLNAQYRGDAPLPFASVVCSVGPDRDEQFRTGLAEEIAAALEATADTSFLYIEFRPTDPGLVYYARDGRLVRAERPDPLPAQLPVPLPTQGMQT